MGSSRGLYRPNPDSRLVSEYAIYTTRLTLTWKKMTVAVCLVVALRTSDLRCADMTNGWWLRNSSQIVTACKKTVRRLVACTVARALQTEGYSAPYYYYCTYRGREGRHHIN